MGVYESVKSSVIAIIKEDKKMVATLVYYSFLEALLVLSIPLSSSFVINSVIAHAHVSIIVLGLIVFALFIFVTLLRLMKKYIIEKFQQRLFVSRAIDIALESLGVPSAKKQSVAYKKHMNYFFDIMSLQKFFPILMLDGLSLVVRVFVSLILLFLFDNVLFEVALVFFILYSFVVYWLGKNALSKAIKRSDTKHEAIFCLQNLHEVDQTNQTAITQLDEHLSAHTHARRGMFRTIFSQQAATFLAEAIILSGFLTIGGFLVVNGSVPLGEFIASEIVILTLVYALDDFVKKLDFFYDTIEGFYKIDKLFLELKGEADRADLS